MARNPHLNESKYVHVRELVIDKLTSKFNLTTLIDFGLNGELYDSLKIQNIIGIEIVNEFLTYSDRYQTIHSDYITEAKNHLYENTCYTFFSILPKNINRFESFKQFLFENSKQNTFLINWYNTEIGQNYTIYDLQKQKEIFI